MKFNLNQIFLFVSIIVIVFWLLKISKRIENFESVADTPDAILYVESRDKPNPFIVHDMAKKMTSDENKLRKIIRLAGENKKNELLALLKSL